MQLKFCLKNNSGRYWVVMEELMAQRLHLKEEALLLHLHIHLRAATPTQALAEDIRTSIQMEVTMEQGVRRYQVLKLVNVDH
ncbi:hypothetical protein CLV58_113112 [Spirosoma oryzae]|uniref:Uncharacterized protein n=1 Tax=Spirosoma oryzae TaxID=1469603 RepID=A0A2T0SRD6_9BACT|nr:hypothetical protein CLV58_113112 [Spirosoma oryzae]